MKKKKNEELELVSWIENYNNWTTQSGEKVIRKNC